MNAHISTRPLLEVRELCVQFQHAGRRIRAVDGLTFHLCAGSTLAIIGESGSGKTVSCRALMGLLPESAQITGSARLCDTELVGLTERQMRSHRGTGIAMIFQDPVRSLNPTMRVGQQITEAIRQHTRLSPAEARERALRLLGLLRVTAPEQRYMAYPHELSGGMSQRVMIAIALAGNPRLLIADEATRALDAITQMQTLRLLKDLQRRFGMALIMVSHDLRLAASFADNVLVMYAGRAVEQVPTERLFTHARMRYTSAMLAAIPGSVQGSATEARVGLPRKAAGTDELLRVENIVQEFNVRGARGNRLRALSNVSFSIRRGEALGLVGESGSGKTTLARLLMQIPRPKSGSVYFRGTDLTQLRGRALLQHRRHLQLIFQDPSGSLNPKWTVAQIVEEPLRGYGVGTREERRRKTIEALERVGLPANVYALRRPDQLSGGQCQRVAIARALTLEPALLVCDEAVSALDVLIQAQLLNLFAQLRADLGLSYLFISHDLSLVRQISDRVAVLHLGQICEIGPAEALFRSPRHPCTALLLAAIPGRVRDHADPLTESEGESSPLDPPTGCRFRTRCPHAQDRCAQEETVLRAAGENHWVACHFPNTTT